jgi:aminoglycoside phosphotransferase (APT) family kinase protein
MLHAIIPEHRHKAVEVALRAVFGAAPIERATPLRDGFSGALVNCVEISGRKVLLRVETGRDALRDPVRQYACMRAAAQAGIAPPLHYADAETGVAIMDFIEARPISDYPGGAPAAALELAGLTARLQRTTPFAPLVEQVDGVDGLFMELLATGLCARGALAEHQAAWASLRDACPRTPPERRVSSHNDLNPNNMLYDGERMWLIDWEVAFANDPLVDPASIAFWYGLEGEAQAALLRAAFGKVDDGLRARFFLMRQVSQVFNGVLMLRLAAQARAPDAEPITDMTAPPFAQVRAGLATRTLDLGSQEGRLLFGKAALNAVRDSVGGTAFAAAAHLANSG